MPALRQLTAVSLVVFAAGLAACGGSSGFRGSIRLDQGVDAGKPPASPDLVVQPPDLATPDCAPGRTRCDGDCVDTSRDVANCGDCGNACANGESCQGGVCRGAPMMMTGCKGAVGCLNMCMDMTCQQTCLKNTTAKGQMLLQAALTCLQTACPRAKQGDPCFDPNAMACDTCYSKAQAQGGACFKAISDCIANAP